MKVQISQRMENLSELFHIETQFIEIFFHKRSSMKINSKESTC